RERPDPEAPEILDAIDRAIAEAIASGTALIGDISNTLVTMPRLTQSPLAAVVFLELIRFNPADAAALVAAARADLDARHPTDRVRASIAAHAPYSVAPALFRAIRGALDDESAVPCSVHVSEAAEEIEFIERGTGPWRTLLEELRVWDSGWKPPQTTPVRYLDSLGFITPQLLAVHGVQMTEEDLAVLRDRQATLVTCPRSNGHTGAGAPPIADFYNSGIRVAVGTDSLASAPDLNVFAELATMRALAPGVPAAALLDSATRQGARALGFDADYGTSGRDCSPSRFRTMSTMWKNISSAESNRVRFTGLKRDAMISRVRTYASFVRFGRSVFALPFAFAGALLAFGRVSVDWRSCWCTHGAMVAGRVAAMGFNRLVDARI